MSYIKNNLRVSFFILSSFICNQALCDWVWGDKVSIASNPGLISWAVAGYMMQGDRPAILLLSGPNQSFSNTMLQSVEYSDGKWSDIYTIARGSIEIIDSFQDDNGDVEIFWVDVGAGAPKLMYSKYSSPGVSESQIIADNFSFNYKLLEVNGDIYIAWLSQDKTTNLMTTFEAHRVSGAWSKGSLVASDDYVSESCRPIHAIYDLAALQNGTFSISLKCGGSKSMIIAFNKGARVSEKVFNKSEYGSALSYDHDGNLHVLASGSMGVITSIYKGGWQPDIILDDIPAISSSVCGKEFNISSKGELFLTWASNGVIQGKKYANAAWGPYFNISDPSTDGVAHHCRIVKSATDNLYMVWNGSNGVHYTFLQDGKWQAPRQLDANADSWGWNLKTLNRFDPDAITLSTKELNGSLDITGYRGYRIQQDEVSDFGIINGFNPPYSEGWYSIFLINETTALAWGNYYNFGTKSSYVISNIGYFSGSKRKNLSVKILGSGQGIISSQPAGIDCGLDCIKSYSIDSKVTLVAKPSENSVFSGWSGDCTGKQDCQLIMTKDHSVSAQFDTAPSPTLKVVFQKNGIVSSVPSGILCGGANRQCVSSFSSVKLDATPNPGYEFIRWNGCPTPDGNVCNIKPISKMTVSAAFRKLPKYNVKITKNNLGSITSLPGGLNCPDKKKSCVVKFIKGTQVTLTAVPQAGRTFGGWTGTCSGLEPCTFLVDGNRGIGAIFE